MKNWKKFALGGIFLIFLVTLSSLFYWSYVYQSKNIFQMDAVINTIEPGLNSDYDSLHFGSISKKAIGARTINIVNSEDFPIKVYVRVEGDLEKWTYYPEPVFYLAQGESNEIEFKVRAPEDVESKRYYGSAIVTIERDWLFN
jgi:hypothetical protein